MTRSRYMMCGNSLRATVRCPVTAPAVVNSSEVVVREILGSHHSNFRSYNNFRSIPLESLRCSVGRLCVVGRKVTGREGKELLTASDLRNLTNSPFRFFLWFLYHSDSWLRCYPPSSAPSPSRYVLAVSQQGKGLIFLQSNWNPCHRAVRTVYCKLSRRCI